MPFRSIASRLIKGLSEEARQVFQLDVLRPPTFLELGRVLQAGRRKGSPYHVVHFDGHGVYADASDPGRLTSQLAGLSPLFFTAPKQGKHGSATDAVQVSFDAAQAHRFLCARHHDGAIGVE